jgi:hypothetical protein
MRHIHECNNVAVTLTWKYANPRRLINTQSVGADYQATWLVVRERANRHFEVRHQTALIHGLEVCASTRR